MGVRIFSLLVCLIQTALALSSINPAKVAVIGTTGRLGREAIQQLSKQGIGTRCLLRHDISSVTPPSSLDEAENSAEVAAYLSTLRGVEMVQGDVCNKDSLRSLVQDTNACLALYGPLVPKPFFKALFPVWFPESEPKHPKQVNYEGVKNLLQVLSDSPTCNRLVRITGKGETPWSIFSILINAFGGLAKGWNYEAEELIRTSAIDYTIIRPGIMKVSVDEVVPKLGFKDNGGDLKVSAVSYSQIADLSIQVTSRDNCQRSTVTAMNVQADDGQDFLTLDQIQPDTREFPVTLLAEHKKAARVGGLAIISATFLMTDALAILAGKLLAAFK
jgi:NAD(P)-dependent dehydrogenase (short-subunit alcohol dehydrogenase family)